MAMVDSKLTEAQLPSSRHIGCESKLGAFMKTFLNMLRDDSGASAAEYALILAIIGAAIAIAAIGLGGAISGAMDSASSCISTPETTCAADPAA